MCARACASKAARAPRAGRGVLLRMRQVGKHLSTSPNRPPQAPLWRARAVVRHRRRVRSQIRHRCQCQRKGGASTEQHEHQRSTTEARGQYWHTTSARSLLARAARWHLLWHRKRSIVPPPPLGRRALRHRARNRNTASHKGASARSPVAERGRAGKRLRPPHQLQGSPAACAMGPRRRANRTPPRCRRRSPSRAGCCGVDCRKYSTNGAALPYKRRNRPVQSTASLVLEHSVKYTITTSTLPAKYMRWHNANTTPVE